MVLQVQVDVCMNKDEAKPEETGCMRQRHVLAFVACLGFVNIYAMRVNINVAIVAMVDHGSNDSVQGYGECGRLSSNATRDTIAKPGEFYWERSTQELILSSFYYGYIILQIPAGWLAEWFGAKHLFGIGVLGCSIFTLLTAVAARHSVELLIAVRVAQGLFQGLAFPCMHVLWSKWAPPLERSKLVTFTYAGGPLGILIAMPLTGLLCDYGFDGGWPSAFYVFGTAGVLWYVCWLFLAHESPAVHPRISKSEREYIGMALKQKHIAKVSFFKLPWLKFFTSLPFLAIIAVNFCNGWGAITLLTNLPMYMKEVQDFDIKKNGILSAVPYLAQWIFTLLGAIATDALMNRKLLRTVNARKLANAIGLLSPAACLVGAGYVACDSTAVVVLLVIAVGINGIANSGFQINHLDIAPKYAGTLMGIGNTIGNMAGIVAPLVVADVTREKQTSTEWQIIFFITAAVYLLGTVLYTAMAADQVQEWAEEAGQQKTASETVRNARMCNIAL